MKWWGNRISEGIDEVEGEERALGEVLSSLEGLVAEMTIVGLPGWSTVGGVGGRGTDGIL